MSVSFCPYIICTVWFESQLTLQSFLMWTSTMYVVFGYCTFQWHQPAPSPSSICILWLRKGTAGGTSHRHRPEVMEKRKSFTFLCQEEPENHFHIFDYICLYSGSCCWCPAIHSSLFNPSTAWLFTFLFWDPVDSVSPGNSASSVWQENWSIFPAALIRKQRVRQDETSSPLLEDLLQFPLCSQKQC